VDTFCNEEEVKKRGILEVEENQFEKRSRKVLSFLEKPSPEETKSRY